MRDRRIAPIFILLLVGLAIVFFLQNSTPTISLEFVGVELPSLPLAAWLFVGAIAGFVTSLALGGLWRQSQRNLHSSATRFAERDWEEDTHRKPTPSKRSRKKSAKRKAAATRQDAQQPTNERHSEPKTDKPDELNEPAPWDNWEEPKDTPINVEATATEGGRPRDQQLRTQSGDPTTPGRETGDEFPEDEQENELATNTTEWLGEEFFEDWKRELDGETEPSDTGDAGEVSPGRIYERHRQPIRQYWSGSVYSYTYGDPETSTTSEVDDNQNQTSSPENAPDPDQVPLESEAEPSEVEFSADVPTTPQPSTQETTAEKVSWDESLDELEIEDRDNQETVGDNYNEPSSEDFPEEDDEDWQTGPSSKFRPSPTQSPTGLAQRFVQKIVSPSQSNSQANTPENQERTDKTNDAENNSNDWEDDWENPPKKSNTSDDW
jgi:hypothetical protein